jgi:hypothetical protein
MVAVQNQFVSGGLLFAQPLKERGMFEKVSLMMMVWDEEESERLCA